ncbi:MAG TPA: thioredoxin-dependent thiol peroxidase [Candidatus Dormibacteraeota bacterium]|nr:thioredoxin-dependent thiol peroxidase [Candidatus Dormibacteraeota bacterium]
MSRPNPGDQAPAFRVSADDGSEVSRDGLIGRRYILYFYPKDDTPGCTAQACSLRDNFRRVTGTGVEVFGVSTDSVTRHVKFRAKYDLPYRLLSDEAHQMAEAYGVWVEKGLMGKTYMGTERTSFIIGPDGRVEHVLPKVKPNEHVDLLLEAMAA